MLQFSVYARVCNGNDAVKKHESRLGASLPPNGSIRLLVVTEKQYQSIQILLKAQIFHLYVHLHLCLQLPSLMNNLDLFCLANSIRLILMLLLFLMMGLNGINPINIQNGFPFLFHHEL